MIFQTKIQSIGIANTPENNFILTQQYVQYPTRKLIHKNPTLFISNLLPHIAELNPEDINRCKQLIPLALLKYCLEVQREYVAGLSGKPSRYRLREIAQREINHALKVLILAQQKLLIDPSEN